jgi:hypothetical protein
MKTDTRFALADGSPVKDFCKPVSVACEPSL